jgi:hypothetical protein
MAKLAWTPWHKVVKIRPDLGQGNCAHQREPGRELLLLALLPWTCEPHAAGYLRRHVRSAVRRILGTHRSNGSAASASH